MSPRKSRRAVRERSVPGSLARSRCPVANSLEILGDRWTLLVIRDLFHGKKRYAEFAASKEGIPTNILSDRLKRLEDAGVIGSTLYSRHPPRAEYALTPKGRGLGPTLQSLIEWGLKYIPGTKVLEDRSRLRVAPLRDGAGTGVGVR